MGERARETGARVTLNGCGAPRCAQDEGAKSVYFNRLAGRRFSLKKMHLKISFRFFFFHTRMEISLHGRSSVDRQTRRSSPSHRHMIINENSISDKSEKDVQWLDDPLAGCR